MAMHDPGHDVPIIHRSATAIDNAGEVQDGGVDLLEQLRFDDPVRDGPVDGFDGAVTVRVDRVEIVAVVSLG